MDTPEFAPFLPLISFNHHSGCFHTLAIQTILIGWMDEEIDRSIDPVHLLLNTCIFSFL